MNRLSIRQINKREQADDALRRLKALIEPMVDRHSKEMGVKPSAVYYKAMISRWGVCNVRDKSICCKWFYCHILFITFSNLNSPSS